MHVKLGRAHLVFRPRDVWSARLKNLDTEHDLFPPHQRGRALILPPRSFVERCWRETHASGQRKCVRMESDKTAIDPKL